jgi:hypothetical protein
MSPGRRARTVARVLLRAVWGLSLAMAAMVIGVGIELHSSGAGALVSYPVVVAGVLLVPLASAVIERLAPASWTASD